HRSGGHSNPAPPDEDDARRVRENPGREPGLDLWMGNGTFDAARAQPAAARGHQGPARRWPRQRPTTAEARATLSGPAGHAPLRQRAPRRLVYVSSRLGGVSTGASGSRVGGVSRLSQDKNEKVDRSSAGRGGSGS